MTLAELAAQTNVPARTVRFYITKGLLPRPRRGGRGAMYGIEHLKRIEQVRALQARGLTLTQIAGSLGGNMAKALTTRPTAWWSYPIQEDIMLWVRADASPWRLRQVRNALAEISAQLGSASKEEKNEKKNDDHDR
jgi:DNA-binding transcriptional MerR regulator